MSSPKKLIYHTGTPLNDNNFSQSQYVNRSMSPQHEHLNEWGQVDGHQERQEPPLQCLQWWLLDTDTRNNVMQNDVFVCNDNICFNFQHLRDYTKQWPALPKGLGIEQPTYPAAPGKSWDLLSADHIPFPPELH